MYWTLCAFSLDSTKAKPSLHCNALFRTLRLRSDQRMPSAGNTRCFPAFGQLFHPTTGQDKEVVRCRRGLGKAKGAPAFTRTPLTLSNQTLVRMKRLELSLRLRNSDLNAARLPIPPHPHVGLVLDARYLATVEWEEKSLFRGKAEPGTGGATS
jgi:hypothetical protein